MKRTKRMLSLLLAACMMLSALPLTANAEETKVNFIENDEVYVNAADVEETETDSNIVVTENNTATENEVVYPVEINKDNFPDEIFRTYVSDNFDKDTSGDLSASEVQDVTRISVNSKGITSLKGIEFFPNLTLLSCSSNQLTSLDVSKNTALETISCTNNQLTTLNVNDCAALFEIYCASNLLMTLDVSGCTALKTLWCYFNSLMVLDVSKCTALTYIDCSDNLLTAINVNGCTALTNLSCRNNKLTMLDVSGCTALRTIHCESNQLNSIDFSNNTALTRIDCWSNQIVSINVSKNTSLKFLYCYSNNLESITVDDNKLENLNYVDLGTQSVTIPTSAFTYSDGKYTYNGYEFDEMPTTFTGTFTLSYGSSKTATMTINYTVIEVSAGDFTADGSVDVSDLARIRSYLANYDYSTSASTVKICTEADMNGDGVINLKDLVALRSALAKTTA